MGPLLQLAQAGSQTVTEVTWPHAPAPWQVFLIFAMVIAFAAVCYLLEPRDERRFAKVPLALLRGGLIVLAIAVLFRPTQNEELREVKNGYTVLAIDTSRSMDFEDRERDEALRESIAEALGVRAETLRRMTRLDQVKTALRRQADGRTLLHRLAEKNRLRLYTFDSTRRRLSDVDKLEGEAATGVSRALAELDGVVADGQSTAVGDSLQRILTDLRSERVSGLVLLTDGRSNAGSLSAEAVATRFGRQGIPIYAVGVGDPDPPRDLAVDDFRAPDVSLAGDVLRGSLLVRATGYTEPREVRVRVRLGEDQVAEETGLVGGDRPEWEVHFSTQVARPGEYTLEAILEPDPDELTTDNNRAVRRVRVIDERIRVLYVEGYPRWEYRYLKNALTRDRHMEVQVLLLSADPGFVQETSPNVPPLVRMPGPQALLDYHVIILGDVDPEALDRNGERVFADGAFEAMRTVVKDRGGGLLMISGDQAAPRRFLGTPVADLLPVVIEETGPVQRDFTRPWRPRLTRAGLQDDLLLLADSERENRELWDFKLPELYWYSQVERTKPQAHVLAVHPHDRNQHGPYPLMAWQRYGAGTAFWLGIDETWRWRAEVGDRYQYRLYGHVLRFLSLQSFTRTKRFFITTDKTSYDVGEEVRVRVEVRDDDLPPPPGATEGEPRQQVQLDLPDGSTETLNLGGIEGEPGRFEGVIKPVQTGPYRLHAEPGERFGADEVAARVFDVKLPRLELQDPRMDREELTRIAAASGGRFLRLDELAGIPDELEELTESILVRRTPTDLWDQPWVLLLFLGIAVTEWIGRKLTRML